MLSPFKMTIIKTPIIGGVYERFIYNTRHSKYKSMYNKPFVNEIDVIEDPDEEKNLFITDCSNCMLCCHSKAKYLSLNSSKVICTHEKKHDCNSWEVVDDLTDRCGSIKLWEDEREFYKKEPSMFDDKPPVYRSYDGRFCENAEDMKKNYTDFYNYLTEHRILLRDVEKDDIRHIFKTILESDAPFMIVNTDVYDMDAMSVWGKVELVKKLKELSFTYNISFIDYDTDLFTFGLIFEEGVSFFGNSKEVNLYLSYKDMKKMVYGINMDDSSNNIWKHIEHRLNQKKAFKYLD